MFSLRIALAVYLLRMPFIVLAGALVLPSTLSQAATQTPVVPISAQELPNIYLPETRAGDRFGGNLDDFKMAVTRQIEKCKTQNLNEAWTMGKRVVTRKEWCVETGEWFLKTIAQSSSLSQVLAKAKTDLDWYASVGKTGTQDVFYTGYYYPKIKVKLKPDARYRYPFYKKPQDLVLKTVNGKKVWSKPDGSKYYTRAQIEGQGVLKNKGLEIAYAASPLEVNTVMVQGSGMLSVIEVDPVTHQEVEVKTIFANYAAPNGRAYTSIRDIFIQNGVPEEYWNYAGIYRYFSEHPEDWEKFSYQNESYVFFNPATEGPFGGSGIKLTPRHSIAIDSGLFKYGLFSLIQSEHPDVITSNGVQSYRPYLQLTITQDTGGKIKSPGRVDVYWGAGDDAKLGAGHPEIEGKLFFAVLKAK